MEVHAMGKKRTRKQDKASFKSQMTLAVIQGDKTISELASQFGVHGNLVSQWKRRLLANVSRVFEEPDDPEGRARQEMIDGLHPSLRWFFAESAGDRTICPLGMAAVPHAIGILLAFDCG